MKNSLLLFDEIQYRKLIPWLDENKPDEKFTALLSEIKNIEPEFQPQYEIEFYRPFNHKTKYYHKLIQNASIDYCNKIHHQIIEDDRIKLHKYWRNDTLNKKLPARLRDIGKIIKERQYSLDYTNPHKSSFEIDSDHKTETYILQLLKIALIRVYLEIQNFFQFIPQNDLLVEEDFYTQFLFEPVPSDSSIKKILLVNIISKQSKSIKISFGYNLPTTNNLKNTCKLLTLKIDFLDDNFTSLEDFIEVMTSKDLAQVKKQIHIGCETTQFRYIVDKYKPYFNTLTLSNIEKSKCFYSKNNVLITATNLSRNKHHDPKEKTTIDNIFNQMQ